MRVLIITESFLPHMNGVTGTVLHVAEYLGDRGDQVSVIAPGAKGVTDAPAGLSVQRLRSVALPRYRDVRVATTLTPTVSKAIRQVAPDVVHLASPILLGWQAVTACRQLGIPTVAVYQTDVPDYAARYGLPGFEGILWAHVARLHRRASITLAPSSHSVAQLEQAGVPRIARWGRGVDTELFHPGKRDEAFRARIAPNGETIVGYVGRLAPEKQVNDLAVLHDVPGIRLVIVGDGPERARLEALLPRATFLGFKRGQELATIAASFDVAVHPGESETFCQTIQEANASGVPVVAVGAGGPLDLVHNSVDGWLYAPGDLAGLRARVLDFAGDPSKRAAMGQAARLRVSGRTWAAVCAELDGHYRKAIEYTRALPVRGGAA